MLFFVVGSLSCYIMYNVQFLLMMYLQTLISYLTARRKFFVWTLAAVWLFILNYLKLETNYRIMTELLNINESKIHDFLIIFAWNLLKNISFNLERLDAPDRNDLKFSFFNCLGYVFYFPTFMCGPHVIYSRFAVMLDRPEEELRPSRARYQSFILNLLRFAFWFFLTEFALHFFYINSIVLNLDLKLLNPLTFFGVGYLTGQFFNNKYIIHYGVPITFGQLDGIAMPKTPICICRVHKYSDMWKWFDHGLYEFLFKYIYTKTCHQKSSPLRKVIAGLVTFLFIYVWHGFFDYILIWSLLNCACIVLEKLVYHIIDSDRFFQKALEVVKSENNVHRLRAFIGTHVLIPAVLSNFFFFGGVDVGWEFMRRTYLDGFVNYFKISSCIFLLYPVAEALKRWHKLK